MSFYGLHQKLVAITSNPIQLLLVKIPAMKNLSGKCCHVVQLSSERNQSLDVR